jgi:hypothetical protein
MTGILKLQVNISQNKCEYLRYLSLLCNRTVELRILLFDPPALRETRPCQQGDTSIDCRGTKGALTASHREGAGIREFGGHLTQLPIILTSIAKSETKR